MSHKTIHTRLLTRGIRKGLSGFWWMLKIIIPISLLTTLLDYSGLMGRMDFLLEPLMGVMHLPGIAAFPLIAGLLTGPYGGIAAMTALPLTAGQMTLIAIFLLISHNLIQEGIIQAKSGINPILTTVFRLMTSICTVLVVMHFLETGPLVQSTGTILPPSQKSLSEALTAWLISTAQISLKMLLVITFLMILLEEMKHFNLVVKLVNLFNPALKLLGLQKNVGILWMTGAVFGIVYGGAVIIEEAKEHHIQKSELMKLHLSMGVNHSLIEDPILFLSLGLNPFWLWVPRIIAAILFVHLFNLIYKTAVILKMVTDKPMDG
ncbi:MAG: nucleoside recognition domain-containing protein [Desulfobacterales bacterium]|nr:nucleoside recognition domain-containing protein [Desulfobacterales bacterium]MDX2511890.1 nucleoside recognition domain-containing protein [Desulfobacterales bacterium]